MGIRVTCPSGHQLNVKSFLAGKKGICPHCQQRFDIPKVEAPAAARKQVARMPAPEIDESTIIAPNDSAADQPAPNAAASDQGPPQSTQQTTPDATKSAVQWYVRPPAGGQYGPADEAMMSEWVADGRVPAEALVWRTGWSDWARADAVAAELPGHSPAPDASTSVSIATIDSAHPTAAAGSPAAVAANRLQRKRKSAAKAQAWAAALLLLTAVVLAVLLVIVLNRDDTTATPAGSGTQNSPP
jgi:hypothetical protein